MSHQESPMFDRGDAASARSVANVDNRETIDSYELCADDYAESTEPAVGEEPAEALKRLVSSAPEHLPIFEIGSGPGWDADWLEQQGLRVTRTDATQAFISFQRGRGKDAYILDVVNDDLGGPYGGVLARYVFQHIDRDLLPAVFAKIAKTLVHEGILVFTLREGGQTIYETGLDGRRYYITMWETDELIALLAPLGLSCEWMQSHEDTDGCWVTMVLKMGTHS